MIVYKVFHISENIPDIQKGTRLGYTPDILVKTMARVNELRLVASITANSLNHLFDIGNTSFQKQSKMIVWKSNTAYEKAVPVGSVIYDTSTGNGYLVELFGFSKLSQEAVALLLTSKTGGA